MERTSTAVGFHKMRKGYIALAAELALEKSHTQSLTKALNHSERRHAREGRVLHPVHVASEGIVVILHIEPDPSASVVVPDHERALSRPSPRAAPI